jgi:hypothetical protein
MSVVNTDIKLRYSTATGSAGLTTAGTAATSLGKYVSTTDVTAPPNAFFDDVSSAEALAGDTEYRCFFVYNSHATDSALNVTVSITGEVALGGTTTAALDNVAIGAANGASALSAISANENTAPTPVGTFSTGPLTVGTLAAGQAKAIWLKRVVSASTAALVGDGFTVSVGGDG